jgi:hypothetical protein
MRILWRLIWTGFAAPILQFLAFEIDYSPIDWIAVPFWFPGVYVITHLIPSDPHEMIHAIALNFVFVWAALFMISTLIHKQLQRRRELACT